LIRIRLPERPAEPLTVPTPEQVRALLDAAEPSFAVAIMLGAHVGLRAGEVEGLRVEDVDFLRRLVHVRRQLVDQPRLMLAEPKTRASVRSVPVPAMVTDALALHLERHGHGPEGVLLHVDGAFMDDNALNYRWRKAQVGAGLRRGSLRFHWLRHAFASSLISAGCSVKAVADAMGHQSPTITLTTYASLWPGDEDRIRAAIERAWTEDSVRTAATGSAV
jgi:integrase